MTAPTSRLALAGRVVTMDAHDTVLAHGVVYIAGRTVEAVRSKQQAPPAGFEGVTPVQTGGTIYPGLIDLHNHLAFNVLKLWHVPRRFSNRDQWRADSVPDYRKLISGPMGVIGKSDAVAALVRYVEAKCLLGGTTTSQGVRLNSNSGIISYFRGVVRNVETPGNGLPPATSHVADVAAKEAAHFRERLQDETCMLLHLAEGTDASAREHFLALHDRSSDAWAIAPPLAGIHCAGLHAEDIQRLAELGGSMVWSPLSNLLLYGATADMATATKAAQKVRIGLGADWSPSGSKNLLGELKVAKLYSDENGQLFSDQELVALATRNAAEILGWQGRLGVIAEGAESDLIVLDGTAAKDPYNQLLKAGESELSAVLVDGQARFGTPGLLTRLGATATETITVGGRKRALNLNDPATHPAVAKLTLKQATAKLADTLKRLPELAKAQESNGHRKLTASAPGEEPLTLALDELEDTGFDQRPRLPYYGRATGPGQLGLVAAGAPPLSSIVEPLELDPLTVADDPGWLDAIERQPNLPPYVTAGLRALYPTS